MGRKPLLSVPQTGHAHQLIEQGEHSDAAAGSLKVSRSIIHRAVRWLFPVWDSKPKPSLDTRKKGKLNDGFQ
jgi:hypothetical protein